MLIVIWFLEEENFWCRRACECHSCTFVTLFQGHIRLGVMTARLQDKNAYKVMRIGRRNILDYKEFLILMSWCLHCPANSLPSPRLLGELPIGKNKKGIYVVCLVAFGISIDV